MYCKNCGHENDDDASFCENCGENLSPPPTSQNHSRMSNANKILIVIVILLIAGIGVAAGMLLTSKAPVANNTTTNTSLNVSEPVTTTTFTNNTNYIGEAKAKQIAIDYLTEIDVMKTSEIRSVDFVTINGVPLYRIKYYDHYVTVYGTETGWEDVLIGAKDGKLYDDYGEKVTN